jgi:hypothetical protein
MHAQITSILAFVMIALILKIAQFLNEVRYFKTIFNVNFKDAYGRFSELLWRNFNHVALSAHLEFMLPS